MPPVAPPPYVLRLKSANLDVCRPRLVGPADDSLGADYAPEMAKSSADSGKNPPGGALCNQALHLRHGQPRFVDSHDGLPTKSNKKPQHPCHPDGALSRVGGPRLRLDPQRKAYRELRPNIDLNGLANVTALGYAVGTESRIVEMDLSKEANPLALTVKGEWDKTGRIQGFGG